MTVCFVAITLQPTKGFALPNNSCRMEMFSPSWLGAHGVEEKWCEQAELFVEAIIMAFESQDEIQRQISPSMADQMGLDNVVGPQHLIEAATTALDNFVIALPGTIGTDSFEQRRQFANLLRAGWQDRREAIYWGELSLREVYEVTLQWSAHEYREV